MESFLVFVIYGMFLLLNYDQFFKKQILFINFFIIYIILPGWKLVKNVSKASKNLIRNHYHNIIYPTKKKIIGTPLFTICKYRM